ncbi:hypothetical protein ACLOJK_029057 [Asimina triloba]
MATAAAAGANRPPSGLHDRPDSLYPKTRSDVYLSVGISSIKRPSAPSLLHSEHPEHTFGRVPVRRNFCKRPSAPFLVFSLAGAADKMHLPMHPPAEQEEETGDVQSPTEYRTPETETSVPNEDYSGGGARITIQPIQPDYAANPAVLLPSPMAGENTAQKEDEAKATIFVMVAIAIMQTAASGVSKIKAFGVVTITMVQETITVVGSRFYTGARITACVQADIVTIGSAASVSAAGSCVVSRRPTFKNLGNSVQRLCNDVGRDGTGDGDPRRCIEEAGEIEMEKLRSRLPPSLSPSRPLSLFISLHLEAATTSISAKAPPLTLGHLSLSIVPFAALPCLRRLSPASLSDGVQKRFNLQLEIEIQSQ